MEKYPNVRPGAHVLLTINEVRRAGRPEFSGAVRSQTSAAYGASGNPKSSAGAGYFLGSSTHAEVVPYVEEYCDSGS